MAGQTVRCLTDNQNVVRIVQVGSRGKGLHDIALDIFVLASQRHIHLDVYWLSRERNSQAQDKSISINDEIFRHLVKLWDPHSVNRFAFSYIPSCLCLTPDFSSKVLKLLMLFCRSGPRKIIGLFYHLYSSEDR